MFIGGGRPGECHVFDPALDEIYQFSKGIPRLINLLCDRALLAGFVGQIYHIEEESIRKVRKSLLGTEEDSRSMSSGFVNRIFRRVFA